MKKIITIISLLLISMSLTVACNQNKEVEVKEELVENKFIEENGLYNYLDTESDVFENAGLKIEVEKENRTAKFIKTDKAGKETADYYLFDFKENIGEKYYFVSAMGNGYYVSVDLESGEAFKMEDKERQDITKSIKESGRWENAALSAEEEIMILINYFEEKFGESLESYVSN